MLKKLFAPIRCKIGTARYRRHISPRPENGFRQPLDDVKELFLYRYPLADAKSRNIILYSHRDPRLCAPGFAGGPPNAHGRQAKCVSCCRNSTTGMSDAMELVRGTENPFPDVGLADPDTKRIKADLAAEIIRVLRQRGLSGAESAKLAGIQEADISRILNADLARFTIDRLVKILNRLDVTLGVTLDVHPRATVDTDPLDLGI